MFDRALRRRIDPSLDRLARKAQAAGLSPDQVSWIGFGLGFLAIVAIASGSEFWGLLLFGANRLCDGVDGSLARLEQPTDRGAYLDIVLDFFSYAGFVFACAVARPEDAVAAAFLIFSFVGTGTTFLAHAIMAAKRQLPEDATHRKGFANLGGLTEGGETIAVFVVMLLFPGAFAALAWIFGILCWLTTATRMHATLRTLPAR
jgi:phosphatidylglycerophosphate synthase